MENFKEKEYKVFEMFDKQWAVVTAGSLEHYNSCTVSWGSLGNIWGIVGKADQRLQFMFILLVIPVNF